jgi:hypothetical protein
MEEVLKTLGKQLTENVKKQPGWARLLVITYLSLYVVGVPADINIAELRLPVPRSVEFWAGILTFILYQVGDALDKVTFKKRDKDGKWRDRFPITKEIEAARNEFGITDGIYDVSVKILEKAGRANSVHFLNEIEKVLRSLLLPALIVATLFALKVTFPWALLPIALGLIVFLVLAFQVYPRFKNLHRIKLYRTIVALLREAETKSRSKTTYQQFGGVRMFFWDGKLVATATVTAPVGPNITTADPAGAETRTA